MEEDHPHPNACNASLRSRITLSFKTILATIRSPAVWIPALIVLALTLVFRLSHADIEISRPYYVNGGRWPLTRAEPWHSLYRWGCYPALILGWSGLLVWLVSFVWKRLEPLRKPGLFLGLALLIGPGLLVNGILKPLVGRPRPHATTPFGGNTPFVHVLDVNEGKPGASFPSGHASMGFFWMTPAFLFFRSRRRLAWGFMIFGLLAGLLMGAARIVAGGHFPSDVLWSGAIVYFTGLFLAIPFRFGVVKTPTP